MKTLSNHTLIYDEDCPLCRAYTGAFVTTGMLDVNGRQPFACTAQDPPVYIDMDKAKNEIALINTAAHTVTYGIDSLLKVIGYSFPVIEKLGTLTPIHYLLTKLYAFISYNRKVIIPAPAGKTAGVCEPSFSYKYRIAYIILSVLLTSAVLYQYSFLLPYLPSGSYYRELLLASGQLLFQAIFLARPNCKMIVNYLGNLMTISLAGSLLLAPVLLLGRYVYLPQYAISGWFLIVVVLMFLEHLRRVKLLGLPKRLSYTWLLYRLLFVILLFLS